MTASEYNKKTKVARLCMRHHKRFKTNNLG